MIGFKSLPSFRFSFSFLLLAALLWVPGSLAAQDRAASDVVHPSLLETLEYRSVGPFRGGRSTAVGGFPDDPHAYIMGTTGGGVCLPQFIE